MFPETIKYWKKMFLTLKATPGKLKALEWIEVSIHVFREFEEVCKGRGILMYALSVLAWVVEIGGLMIQTKGIARGEVNIVNGYLLAAIGGGMSIELRRFVIASVVFLLLIWLLINGFKFIKKICFLR